VPKKKKKREEIRCLLLLFVCVCGCVCVDGGGERERQLFFPSVFSAKERGVVTKEVTSIFYFKQHAKKYLMQLIDKKYIM
jgi:hypothetical protein